MPIVDLNRYAFNHDIGGCRWTRAACLSLVHNNLVILFVTDCSCILISIHSSSHDSLENGSNSLRSCWK